jgi:hypothetical protein
MNRAKRVKTCVTATVILAAVLPLFYCADENNSDIDYLILDPIKKVYYVGQTFPAQPTDAELKVYVVYRNGVSEKIPWSDSHLEVSGDRAFTQAGSKRIVVFYKGASAYFTVAVLGSGGTGGDDTDGGKPGDGDTGGCDTGTGEDTTITIVINW